MNATISYHTVNGKIRSTTVRPTGNSCAENFRFTPYGKQIKTVTGFIPPYFGWVGSYGYRQTNLNHAEQYIRARHYSNTEARWTTRDPLWPRQMAYGYVIGNPTLFIDHSGNSITGTTVKKVVGLLANMPRSHDYCDPCATMMYSALADTPAHHNSYQPWHQYVHCMTCCALSAVFDKNCAYRMQTYQLTYEVVVGNLPNRAADTYRKGSCDYGVQIAYSNGLRGTMTKDIQGTCEKGCQRLTQYILSNEPPSSYPYSGVHGAHGTLPIGAPSWTLSPVPLPPGTDAWLHRPPYAHSLPPLPCVPPASPPYVAGGGPCRVLPRGNPTVW